MFRILHTADWHLGKMLGDMSREEEHRLFLEFLLNTIIDEQIDALLVSGDVFDSANPPQSAISQYYQFLAKVHQLSRCQVIITAGNHDSPAHIEAPRDVLKPLRTHVIGAMPITRRQALVFLPDEQDPLAIIAAIPFLRDRDLRTGHSGQTSSEIQQQLNDAITGIYQEMADLCEYDCPLIAMGHLTVRGASASDSEREIHVGGLGALPSDRFPGKFAYVALGHLHRPQSCGEYTHIRYSGSPIPLSFSESRDHKELRIIEIESNSLQHRAIPIPQSRLLRQVKTSSAELESSLTQLKQDLETRSCQLTPWIEIFINDAVPGDHITVKVAELAKNAPFAVIRIVLQTSNVPATTTWDASHADHHIEDLLGDPVKLFQLRIEKEPQYSEEQKASLAQTFASLLALHRQE